MKRLTFAFLASSLAITGLGLHSSQAAVFQAATFSSPGLESTVPTIYTHPDNLLAGRWNYRFNVRASRYRRGGISRGEECPTEIISSVTPPVDAVMDGELAATTYLGTAAHPVFYISAPQLPKTTLKLTIQL
ncbi:MAG: hypothetical protein AAGA83_19655, partial [Cyanobacteria bacterium P01_F01_bin.116]